MSSTPSTPPGRSTRMKRYLSPEEIDNILEEIPIPRGLPPLIRETEKKKVCASFRKQLSKIQVYPAIIPKVKELILRKYATSLAVVGDMVGILAAQSMESFTQMTLNMFHSAGLSEKNVSLGLPRFEEIMNATRNPKIIGFTFYAKKIFNSKEHLRSSIRLPDVMLENLVKRFSIEHNPVEDIWYSVHDMIFSTEYKKCQWRIRLEVYIDKIFRQNLTLPMIAQAIERQLETTFVVSSPMNPEKMYLDVFVDTIDISNSGGMSAIETQKIYMYETVLKALKSLRISGIPNVEAVYPKENKGDGSWYFEGNGGALIDLLSHPMCDTTATINDHMWDIYECLGLEATRYFLVEEIGKILSFDGTFVNPKGITLLVDRMTLDGGISSVNRYGMNSTHFEPLTRAAFEEAVPNIIFSGIHGGTDKITSVNAAVMTGKAPSIGGAKCDILVDLNMLSTVPENEPVLVEF